MNREFSCNPRMTPNSPVLTEPQAPAQCCVSARDAGKAFNTIFSLLPGSLFTRKMSNFMEGAEEVVQPGFHSFDIHFVYYPNAKSKQVQNIHYRCNNVFISDSLVTF